MKITKRQLKRLIREEKAKLQEAFHSRPNVNPTWSADPEQDEQLYVNQSDEQLECLDDLLNILYRCKELGCTKEDVLDTVAGAY